MGAQVVFEVEAIARRAASTPSVATRDAVTYLGSLLFIDDDLVLCFFDGPSRPAVKLASDRASIPCERLMGSIWLGPGHTAGVGPSRRVPCERAHS
jgi:hypothetical protein